jgi:Class II flagellar assembly regulator
MRIYGPNGAALANAPAAARRTADGTFTVSAQETPRNSSAAGSLRSISSLDAPAGGEDSTERKKRAVAKGPQCARRAR